MCLIDVCVPSVDRERVGTYRTLPPDRQCLCVFLTDDTTLDTRERCLFFPLLRRAGAQCSALPSAVWSLVWFSCARFHLRISILLSLNI